MKQRQLHDEIGQVIDSAFHRAISHISFNFYNIPWLTDIHEFCGDALRINRIGKTSFRSLLNLSLSPFPFLWNSVVYPRFFAQFIPYVETMYLSRIYMQSTRISSVLTFSDFQSTVSKELDSHLKDQSSKLRYWRIIDLFNVIMEVVNALAEFCATPVDLFSEEKMQQNNRVLRVVEESFDEFFTHKHSVYLLLILSMRANWIDSVDPRNDVFLNGFAEEVNELLDRSKELIELHNGSDVLQLKKAASLLKVSQNVMIELDNNGELIVDLLLVEYLLTEGKSVTLVCKGRPVLNDVTIDDVRTVLTGLCFDKCKIGLKNGQLSLIDSNSQIPGKYWPMLSAAYSNAFSDSDLIIVKGQGNFQSMPLGIKRNRTFHHYRYGRPILYSGIIKSSITYQGFKLLPHLKERVKKDVGYLVVLDP